MRKAGELKRIYCRVIDHTRGGYQLASFYGLLSGRFQHQELNAVEGRAGQGEIPNLDRFTPTEAKKKRKLLYPKPWL